ncbi:trypsin-like serine protease [Streptomyces sp. JJ38]|uniref:S1 family peptidase n=1 Tax=Streptomyces sp. JJ38 TaxID=2738128 RepID=UPI001C578A86|nr:trypsin-like serine protease [Streptomyces sp. JJ38]MBW1599489.1 trypsin-like serine protease [Streptomyces sp. JJ38]
MNKARLALGAIALLGTTTLVATGTGTASAAPVPIVGGDYTSSAPSYIAAVGDHKGMFCSGSLVDEQWVITARHCKGAKTVRIGSANLNSGGTLAKVTRTVAHWDMDIRLLKLSEPVAQQPVQLGQASPTPGSDVRLYGFGQTCGPYGCGDMSPRLKQLDTKVTHDAECAGINSSRELCFDTSVGSTDCYGDSGGPAIQGGRLVGVTSRGAQGPGNSTCGKTNSIYGDVTTATTWINRITSR